MFYNDWNHVHYHQLCKRVPSLFSTSWPTFVFVDLKNNAIVNYEYDEVTEINEFGFAGIKKSGKWGVINKAGEIVLEPTYESNQVNPIFLGRYYFKDGIARDYM